MVESWKKFEITYRGFPSWVNCSLLSCITVSIIFSHLYYFLLTKSIVEYGVLRVNIKIFIYRYSDVIPDLILEIYLNNEILKNNANLYFIYLIKICVISKIIKLIFSLYLILMLLNFIIVNALNYLIIVKYAQIIKYLIILYLKIFWYCIFSDIKMQQYTNVDLI